MWKFDSVTFFHKVAKQLTNSHMNLTHYHYYMLLLLIRDHAHFRSG